MNISSSSRIVLSNYWLLMIKSKHGKQSSLRVVIQYKKIKSMGGGGG